MKNEFKRFVIVSLKMIIIIKNNLWAERLRKYYHTSNLVIHTDGQRIDLKAKLFESKFHKNQNCYDNRKYSFPRDYFFDYLKETDSAF